MITERQAGGTQSGLPQGEPSLFWKVMESVLWVALALGAAALLVAALRRLPGWLRKLGGWMRALFHGYLDRLDGEDRGYVDETVTLPQERLRRTARRHPRLPRHWEALPPARQVRLAVGWLRRVRDAAPSETARESLTPLAEDSPLAVPLAQSYDRARYSDHPVTEAEAAQARELVRTAKRKT